MAARDQPYTTRAPPPAAFHRVVTAPGRFDPEPTRRRLSAVAGAANFIYPSGWHDQAAISDMPINRL
jgi:hypothetical protein